jgi:hypothetical protein
MQNYTKTAKKKTKNGILKEEFKHLLLALILMSLIQNTFGALEKSSTFR